MNHRKQPSVAFWATVVLVTVLVGYPLSFGPACWICDRMTIDTRIIGIAYRPILLAWEHSPEEVGAFLDWYSKIGAHQNSTWMSDGTWRRAMIH
jgi:hypothetical protein